MSKVLSCCGKVIKPRRQKVYTDEGIKIFKSGKCGNPKCGIFNLIIESISLFGRVEEKIFRGKKAIREIEKYRVQLFEDKKQRQYRKNTAKGFHYSNSYWDLKENKLKIEQRELATDRLVKREVIELNTLEAVVV